MERCHTKRRVGALAQCSRAAVKKKHVRFGLFAGEWVSTFTAFLCYVAQSKHNRTHGTKRHAEKQNLKQNDVDAHEREDVLRKNGALLHYHDARQPGSRWRRSTGSITGAFPVVPSKEPTYRQRYLRDVRGFGRWDELGPIVTGGEPVNADRSVFDLERAVQHGNHRSVPEHLTSTRKKSGKT